MQFNQSSKELFDLMFRLKEAKKRVRERREQEAAAAAAATEAAANTPARELCSYSCTVKNKSLPYSTIMGKNAFIPPLFEHSVSSP